MTERLPNFIDGGWQRSAATDYLNVLDPATAETKNPIVVLPDADLESATGMIAESAFGCAGQRCLAASLAIAVGDARGPFTEAVVVERWG